MVAARRGGEIEAIVATASGCGVTIKDYAHMLAIDGNYRGKAERISDMTRDLCEVIEPQEFAGKHRARPRGLPGALLAAARPADPRQGGGAARRVGYEVTPVRDAHLCCGSAGTYSLLQPAIAAGCARKLAALEEGAAGDRHGQHRLPRASGRRTATPVRHWIELVDEALA